MKMTVFATNNNQDVDSFHGRDAKGRRALFVVDPEEELITEIDEQRMSPEKIAATRFLKFLEDKKLTLERLKTLPSQERDRLKREFLGD